MIRKDREKVEQIQYIIFPQEYEIDFAEKYTCVISDNTKFSLQVFGYMTGGGYFILLEIDI